MARTFFYNNVVTTGNLLAFSAGSMYQWYSIIFQLYLFTPEFLHSAHFRWLPAMLYIGAMFAPPTTIFITYRKGNKLALISSALILLLAIILFGLTNKLALYYVAQFVGGFGIGGATTSLLIYFAEISEPAKRVSALISINISMMLGRAATYMYRVETVNFLSFNLLHGLVPLIFVTLCWFNMPQSPYYLLFDNREPETIEVLTRLRAGKFEQDELEEIRTFRNVATSSSQRYACLIICVLFFVQKFSGIKNEIYTLNVWFEHSTLDMYWREYIIYMTFYLICVVSYVIGLVLLAKYKKSTVLIVSCCGMAACNIILPFIEDDEDTSIAVGFLFIISYYMGMGIIPWVLMAEMLPVYGKPVELAIAASVNWFSWAFMDLIKYEIGYAFGMSGLYAMYAVFSVIRIIIAVFWMPDTRGKSLKNILEM